MQKLRRSLFILCLFITLSLFFTNNSWAIEYQFLGGRPANPDPEISNSSSWFIYNLDKGEVKEDKVWIKNNFEENLDVLIYAADGEKSSGGGFALKQLSEEQTKVGSWIKFYPDPVPNTFKETFAEAGNSIVAFCSLNIREDKGLFDEWCAGVDLVEFGLDSQQSTEIDFVFSVPEDAEVGEHTGGILIQKADVEREEIEGGGVAITTRVGVRIYQTVPGDIIKEVSIKDFSVTKNWKEFDYSHLFRRNSKPETMTVSTEIENLGNVSVDFEEVITIKDEMFDKKTEETGDRGFQVLRDDTFISNYEWENPRFGKFSFVANIKYLDQNGDPQNLTTDLITITIIPWREIVLATAIVLLVATPIIIKKMIINKKYSGKGWYEYTVKNGQSFEIISSNIDVDWKTFARTNKLKPPYTLKPGQKILIPPKKR